MRAISLQRIRVSAMYSGLIPAVYFMLLGLLDIGMDLFTYKLTWFQTSFNVVFLLPIIFRSRQVYRICGICFSILWAFLLIGGLVEMPGNPRITALQSLCVWIWLLFTLACAVSMWYNGTRKLA